jgi:hypothetical protein
MSGTRISDMSTITSLASGVVVPVVSGGLNYKFDLGTAMTAVGVTPQRFGAVGDGVTDDAVALQAWLNVGGILYLPPGHYYCSARLEVTKHVYITGAGYGFDARKLTYGEMPGSRIRFGAGGGIIFYTQTKEANETLVNANTAAYFTQEGTFEASMVGVGLIGPGGKSLTAPAGVEIRSKVALRDVTIVLFPGNGLDVNAGGADGNTDPDADYGNASGSTFSRLYIYLNGLNGVYIRARDANALEFTSCIFQRNGAWGVLDLGAFGNTYVNCEWATNNENFADASSGGAYRASATSTIGSIKSTSTVAPHSFIACYIEPGQGGQASLTSICSVIGGQLAAPGVHPAQGANSAFLLYGGLAAGAPLRHSNTVGTVGVSAYLGSVESQVAWKFGSSDDNSTEDGFKLTYKFTGDTGWWTLQHANSGSRQLVQYPNALATPRAYAPSFPNGIYIGANGNGGRLCPEAAAMPATGSYRINDFVPNSAPAISGGKVLRGWIRLTTGSAHVLNTDWAAQYVSTT